MLIGNTVLLATVLWCSASRTPVGLGRNRRVQACWVPPILPIAAEMHRSLPAHATEPSQAGQPPEGPVHEPQALALVKYRACRRGAPSPPYLWGRPYPEVCAPECAPEWPWLAGVGRSWGVHTQQYVPELARPEGVAYPLGAHTCQCAPKLTPHRPSCGIAAAKPFCTLCTASAPLTPCASFLLTLQRVIILYRAR